VSEIGTLAASQIGVTDNFALGGDSILAIQVAARARRVGLAVSTRDIFRFQTISELGANAAQARLDAPIDRFARGHVGRPTFPTSSSTNGRSISGQRATGRWRRYIQPPECSAA
jgi:hypothetical protein